MKKKGLKIASGITGAACLLGGCVSAPAIAMPVADPAPEADVAAAPEAEAPEAGVAIEERQQETYTKVANVEGHFAFSQDVLTPPDEVFNLFGTAATYACAKPGFAFDEVKSQEFYINVSGNIKKACTYSLKEIEKLESVERDMMCTCAMSVVAAQASVRGVRVADLVSMAELEDGVNTITMKDAEGYGIPMPLSYVLEKDALLVYEIGDVPLTTSQGAPMQVWMPDTVAKYFTRQVTEIELTAEAEVPVVEGPDADYRAKVSVVNRFEDSFAVGDLIAFEGYADDCGTAIAAVEFSLDGGETWTAYETEGANGDQWVYWHFEYVPEAAGSYKLDVRAVTEDGTVSPLASSVVFTVE